MRFVKRCTQCKASTRLAHKLPSSRSHLVRRERFRRRQITREEDRIAARAGEFDPFGRADEPQSPMMNSPVVAEEAQKIFNTFRELSALQPKYNSFDIRGKRIFVEKMEDLCEQLKVFTTRYSLSSDAYAKEMVRKLSAQLMEAGLTIDSMYEGLKTTTKSMRQLLDEEEKLGAEAVYREPSNMPRLPDFAKLMEDPEIAQLLQDPEIIALLQRAMANPQEFYQESQKNPKLAKIIQKLYESQ